MAAATDAPPRFFKVFISHFSSDSMLIPISYYDELPRLLPKTATLRGNGGCVWNVAVKKERDEVYFGQGWTRFVEDNSLSDGDFLTFVYNGDRIFEVSIYGLNGCKETRAVTQVEDDGEEDSISSLGRSDDTDTSSVSSPRSQNRGKSKEEPVEDSDDKNESVYSQTSEDTDTDTCSEFKLANTIQRSKNKGKKKVEVVDTSTSAEDTDGDYIEAFGRLDVGESTNSTDSSYSPDYEDTTTHVKPKATNPKNKGKSKLTEDVDAVEPVKKREKVKSKIKNPEAYLDDPKNVFFETGVKNRKYELLVHAQLVKDYCLKFPDNICYIDPKGKLQAKTVTWGDQRVCIKKFNHICERNKLKKKDRIVCELLRKQHLVYAVKIHIVRVKYL